VHTTVFGSARREQEARKRHAPVARRLKFTLPLALCHLGRPILAFASHCAVRGRTDGPTPENALARSFALLAGRTTFLNESFSLGALSAGRRERAAMCCVRKWSSWKFIGLCSSATCSLAPHFYIYIYGCSLVAQRSGFCYQRCTLMAQSGAFTMP
jgi:hypothetical protein